MTNAAVNGAAGAVRSFRAIQLLPAPVTLAAIGVAATHHLACAPLTAIAIVGTLATVCSVLLPAMTPSAVASGLPAPREHDRID